MYVSVHTASVCEYIPEIWLISAVSRGDIAACIYVNKNYKHNKIFIIGF